MLLPFAHRFSIQIVRRRRRRRHAAWLPADDEDGQQVMSTGYGPKKIQLDRIVVCVCVGQLERVRVPWWTSGRFRSISKFRWLMADGRPELHWTGMRCSTFEHDRLVPMVPEGAKWNSLATFERNEFVLIWQFGGKVRLVMLWITPWFWNWNQISKIFWKYQRA